MRHDTWGQGEEKQAFVIELAYANTPVKSGRHEKKKKQNEQSTKWLAYTKSKNVTKLNNFTKRKNYQIDSA